MDYSYVFLILLLPALSFILLGLAGMKMSHKVAGSIGTCVLAVVTVLCYYTAFKYFLVDGRGADGLYPTVTAFDFVWIKFSELLTFTIGFRLTPISVMMLIVISTVSFMVHIYSFGYMHGEKGFQRYYAFLSLFTMSMLGLVVATNIFQMYLFWELVGVSSYLLIGFYYPLHSAVAASKKAFIVTRFADLFFLIGILFYSFYVGTFSYDLTAMPELHQNVAGVAWVMPMALFLMFIGGAGKSAMFPLHIWLPDAMEGPTPVSALIHAATMVVAGVYLVASLFPLFVEFAPQALHWIAYIAAFTAFYAAAVACCQSDIKRVLAFSTISQIGFMLVALGVCMPGETGGVDPTVEYADVNGLGYMAGMYHLFTHAMFKACLFLGAGCIIHAVHSNEKMYMGGLRKYMPVTHVTFLISCLAIAGIPFFSGFCSKDEILVACYNFSPIMGVIMSAIATMTAFYMFRLYYVIFWGKSYYETHKAEGAHEPHEAPLTMTVPLIVLSAITMLVGIFGTLHVFEFGEFVSANGLGFGTHINWAIAGTSTVLAILGICLATYMYKGEETPVADMLARRFPRLHEAAYRRFYLDEVWMFVTHKIIFRCISTPIAWFDRHVIDGTFNFMAWGANAAGETIRPWQSGDMRQYAVWFITGTVALTLVLLCI